MRSYLLLSVPLLRYLLLLFPFSFLFPNFFYFHFSVFGFLKKYFFCFFLLLGLGREEKVSHLNSQTLLLGILKTTFQTRQILFDSFYSYMDAKIEKHSTITIDLWILFTLSGNSRNRSKVHTLCARKYSNGSLTRTSLQLAISGFRTALESVFPSILILCT